MKKQLDSLHGSYIPDRAHCRTRQWDTTLRRREHRPRAIQHLAPRKTADRLRHPSSNGSAPTGGRTSSDSTAATDAATPAPGRPRRQRPTMAAPDDEKDVPEAFVRACDQAETRARIIRNKGKDVKK